MYPMQKARPKFAAGDFPTPTQIEQIYQETAQAAGMPEDKFTGARGFIDQFSDRRGAWWQQMKQIMSYHQMDDELYALEQVEEETGQVLGSRKQAVSPPGMKETVKEIKEKGSAESPWAVAWDIYKKKHPGYKPKSSSTKQAEESAQMLTPPPSKSTIPGRETEKGDQENDLSTLSPERQTPAQALKKVAWDFTENQDLQIGDYVQTGRLDSPRQIYKLTRVQDVYAEEEEFESYQEMYGNEGLSWEDNSLMTVHIEGVPGEIARSEAFIYEVERVEPTEAQRKQAQDEDLAERGYTFNAYLMYPVGMSVEDAVAVAEAGNPEGSGVGIELYTDSTDEERFGEPIMDLSDNLDIADVYNIQVRGDEGAVGEAGAYEQVPVEVTVDMAVLKDKYGLQYQREARRKQAEESTKMLTPGPSSGENVTEHWQKQNTDERVENEEQDMLSNETTTGKKEARAAMQKTAQQRIDEYWGVKSAQEDDEMGGMEDMNLFESEEDEEIMGSEAVEDAEAAALMLQELADTFASEMEEAIEETVEDVVDDLTENIFEDDGYEAAAEDEEEGEDNGEENGEEKMEFSEETVKEGQRVMVKLAAREGTCRKVGTVRRWMDKDRVMVNYSGADRIVPAHQLEIRV